MSNLGTNTIEPLFGQANDNVFRTVIEEALLDTVWKNSDSDSGLKSIKAGIDLKRMTTRAESFNSGNFAWGYYNPAEQGLIPASAFTKVSSCSILKQFSGGACGIQVPYFYSFSLASAIAATQAGVPGDGNFPPYTFAQNPSPTNDDHIKEDTPAPFLQMDFDTTFDGMRLRALAGIRYEKSTVTAQSLEKVPTSIQWNNPTEFSTNFAPNATYSDVRSSYAEFLPNLDLSLQVLPDVLLRGSYSKTIARSDLTQMIGTTSVTFTPKPGSRTATAGNPGLLPYESNNIDLGAEWYYAQGSYVSANWFTKHVTNFLTEVTTQGPLFGITDPNAGALANKAIAELTAAGTAVTAQSIFAQIVKDTKSNGPFLGQPGDPLVIWDITAPTNANKTDIHGFELSVQHLFGASGFGVQANWSVPTGGAPWNSLTIGNPVRTAGSQPFLQLRRILREIRLPDSRGVHASRRVLERFESDRPEQRTGIHGGVWPARYECELRYHQAFLRVVRCHQPHVSFDASVRPVYRAVLFRVRGFRTHTRSAFAWCCSRLSVSEAASFRGGPRFARVPSWIGGSDSSAESRECVPRSPA